jgi:hypothetical protein|tara:strand:- start:395 stop:736 length:342 start_codon:yes stop_codon:yes gene_type:complete
MIALMIRKTENPKKLFYVSCADWESVVESIDKEEAGALALEKANKEYGSSLCLSPTICVFDITKSYNEMNDPDSVHFIYTPNALANAGMHSLSKKYSKVIGLLKDNHGKTKDL